jgi:hypothetical protein
VQPQDNSRIVILSHYIASRLSYMHVDPLRYKSPMTAKTPPPIAAAATGTAVAGAKLPEAPVEDEDADAADAEPED